MSDTTSPPTPPPVARTKRGPLGLLVRKLYLPLVMGGLGLAFAGGRILFGSGAPSGLTGGAFILMWTLFGLAYGALVLVLELLRDFGFGGRWSVWLAPALGLTLAWWGYGLIVGPEWEVMKFFLVAAVASLILTPVMIYLARLFFR